MQTRDAVRSAQFQNESRSVLASRRFGSLTPSDTRTTRLDGLMDISSLAGDRRQVDCPGSKNLLISPVARHAGCAEQAILRNELGYLLLKQTDGNFGPSVSLRSQVDSYYFSLNRVSSAGFGGA